MLTFLAFLFVSEQSLGHPRHKNRHYRPQKVVVIQQRPICRPQQVVVVQQRPVVVYQPRRYYYRPARPSASISIQARF